VAYKDFPNWIQHLNPSQTFMLAEFEQFIPALAIPPSVTFRFLPFEQNPKYLLSANKPLVSKYCFSICGLAKISGATPFINW
jgi:hypothetical protein